LRAMEEFIREREQIRRIVGQIGGKPTLMSKAITVLLIVFDENIAKLVDGKEEKAK